MADVPLDNYEKGINRMKNNQKIKLTLESFENSINIDLYELFKELSDEQKMKLAEVITWDNILKEAVRRLTGESENYCEDADSLLTLQVLVKMEQRLLSGYSWHILDDLRQLACNIISHEILYWKMYHDEKQGAFFQGWLEKNNIQSNYTTEFEDFQAFKVMVENKLNEFGNQLKVEDKDDDERIYRIADIWMRKITKELEKETDTAFADDCSVSDIFRNGIINAIKWTILN